MLKLADFGLAMKVTDPIYTICGTPTYVAPEILTEKGYGLEVDTWAVGIMNFDFGAGTASYLCLLMFMKANIKLMLILSPPTSFSWRPSTKLPKNRSSKNCLATF